ncbi:MAG: hypothetical protein CM1200mP16_03450 [Nitrospina sp.]|nr:MAG: hypothetical protein CM1200mP16_03450 [Nitrospina sp.]
MKALIHRLETYRVLFKTSKKYFSLTDFIVNAGGVIGCAVEQKLMQDKDYASKVKIKNTRNYTENLILKTISTNVIEIFSRIRKDDVLGMQQLN